VRCFPMKPEPPMTIVNAMMNYALNSLIKTIILQLLCKFLAVMLDQ
jgi:hypothetical protein